MGIYTRPLGFIILMLAILLPGQTIAQRKKKNKKQKEEQVAVPVIVNYEDSIAYALGMGTAKNLINSDVDSLNMNAFHEGFKAIFNDDSTLIPSSEIQSLLMDFFQQKKIAIEQAQMKAGVEFLEKNKLRPEVDTTISGLQYEVIRKGEGPKPDATSRVTVDYEGKLINGTIFDSSYKKGKPIQFSLGGVIAGWTEGLQLMSPGAKYIFYIPPHLGYGARANGQIN